MIDLHTHTTCSDGDLSPQELLKYAKACGVTRLSITDHDSLDAYRGDIRSESAGLGVTLIMGMELSTTDELQRSYHILGYGADLARQPLLSRLQVIRQERRDRAMAMSAALRKIQWRIDDGPLFAGDRVLTKAHVAEAVLSHPENGQRLRHLWRGTMPNIGAFVERYLIAGKPCYVPAEDALHPAQAIDLIHQARGVAILAHPSEYALKGDDLDHVLLRMKAMGIDGVEAISVVFDRTRDDRVLEHRTLLTSFAQRHGLLITGGSDFHTKQPARFGPFIDIGLRNHEWKVPDNCFRDLLQALRARLKNPASPR